MENLSINLQWHRFLRHCAQHAKQGVIAELDCGVVVCWTQSNWLFMNEFFLSTPVMDELDLRRRLEAIKAYVRKVQPTFPWMLLIQPEWLPSDIRERTREICLAADFTHAFDAKCMQTTSLLPPLRPLPAVEVKFATSKQDVLDAALLNVQAYNTDAFIAQNLVDNHAIIDDFEKELCCLVLVNSKPVATATTALLDDCLYVAFVATSEQHRKNGYAEVALRASIERALEQAPNTKHGIVLHGTKLGQSVYERLGFKNISHVEFYLPKSSTSA